jgi:hypothetical protein
MLNGSFKWSYNQTRHLDKQIIFGAELCKAHYLTRMDSILVYNFPQNWPLLPIY